MRHLTDGPYFAGSAFHLVDAVYGPIFRYFDIFDRIEDFGIMTEKDQVTAWRANLAKRPSIQNAVVLTLVVANTGGLASVEQPVPPKRQQRSD